MSILMVEKTGPAVKYVVKTHRALSNAKTMKDTRSQLTPFVS